MKLSLTERVRFKLGMLAPVKRVPSGRRRGAVSICFDDFPKSAWQAGGPVLEEQGARATYFVSGTLCGREFSGVRQFDEADLQELHERGHEVGCHTFEHESVLRMGRGRLRSSLDRNAAWLKERLGDVRVVSFAYPYGHLSLGAERICSQRFAVCRGTDFGLNRQTLELAAIKAVGLERRRQGEYDLSRLIEEAAAEKAWLVFYTHDVAEAPSEYGCRPCDLDRVLRLARSAQLDVLTLKAALAQELSGSAAWQPAPPQPGRLAPGLGA